MFPKIVDPQIIHLNRVFHYKPSILGVPLFLETPTSRGMVVFLIRKVLDVYLLRWWGISLEVEDMVAMSLGPKTLRDSEWLGNRASDLTSETSGFEGTFDNWKEPVLKFLKRIQKSIHFGPMFIYSSWEVLKHYISLSYHEILRSHGSNERSFCVSFGCFPFLAFLEKSAMSILSEAPFQGIKCQKA